MPRASGKASQAFIELVFQQAGCVLPLALQDDQIAASQIGPVRLVFPLGCAAPPWRIFPGCGVTVPNGR